MDYVHLFNLYGGAIIAKEQELLINEQIKVPEVMVIGPNGEKMGI